MYMVGGTKKTMTELENTASACDRNTKKESNRAEIVADTSLIQLTGRKTVMKIFNDKMALERFISNLVA